MSPTLRECGYVGGGRRDHSLWRNRIDHFYVRGRAAKHAHTTADGSGNRRKESGLCHDEEVIKRTTTPTQSTSHVLHMANTRRLQHWPHKSRPHRRHRFPADVPIMVEPRGHAHPPPRRCCICAMGGGVMTFIIIGRQAGGHIGTYPRFGDAVHTEFVVALHLGVLDPAHLRGRHRARLLLGLGRRSLQRKQEDRRPK